jgi:hypothetical protein
MWGPRNAYVTASIWQTIGGTFAISRFAATLLTCAASGRARLPSVVPCVVGQLTKASARDRRYSLAVTRAVHHRPGRHLIVNEIKTPCFLLKGIPSSLGDCGCFRGEGGRPV